MKTMKTLDQLDAEALRDLRILLTDIDDTITSDGQLEAEAYGALHRLNAAGIAVIPVTGRPAGWCDHIARMWPVAGVVGENGAFYFIYDRKRRKMRQVFWTDAESMRGNRARLDRLGAEILAAVPGSALASDQPYRMADLAIDFCEDVEPLPEAAIERIVGKFHAAGAVAKVSSIHVNGWFGDYDKLTMTRRLLAEEYGLDAAASDKAVIFSGDSPNDEPMFAAFALSVGVANVRNMLHRIARPPTYVTRGHSGDGFAELAERILTLRQQVRASADA